MVFGGKEGVGTTTIAVNLAVALAQHHEQCLLCDAAGGDVSQQLGLKPRHTLDDVFTGTRSLNHVLVTGPAGLQILPGSRTRGKVNSPHLPERPAGCYAQMGTVPFSTHTAEPAWKRLFQQMSELALRPDTTVIDAGSRPDPLARHLWQAADRVLLVATSDTAAMMNAYASIKQFHNPARSVSLALLINRSSGDTSAHEAQRRLTDVCRRFLGLPLRSIGTVPADARRAHVRRPPRTVCACSAGMPGRRGPAAGDPSNDEPSRPETRGIIWSAAIDHRFERPQSGRKR